jgi:hypothetical protein
MLLKWPAKQMQLGERYTAKRCDIDLPKTRS